MREVYLGHNWCPRSGHSSSHPYERDTWLTHIRGDKRVAMNRAIGRHSDVVGEKMDAFVKEMEPHIDLIKDEVRKAEARYRKDVAEADKRHARAMKALIKKVSPKTKAPPFGR